MVKSLYFVELTCVKECEYANVKFNVGEVVWLNPNAMGKEMRMYKLCPDGSWFNTKNKYDYFPNPSYLPFTRQKKFAKKWQIKHYAEKYASIINRIGEFNAVVKEIKLTYSEEEV